MMPDAISRAMGVPPMRCRPSRFCLRERDARTCTDKMPRYDALAGTLRTWPGAVVFLAIELSGGSLKAEGLGDGAALDAKSHPQLRLRLPPKA